MPRIKAKVAAIAMIPFVAVGLTVSASAIATATSGPPMPVTPSTADYCVTFGHGPGAAGNIVEFNWDSSKCPPNSYPHILRVFDSDPFIPPTFYVDSQNPNPNNQHS